MAVNSKATNSRVGTLAKTACVPCRRLKMRCVGADNPPCARCARSGRKCVTRPDHAQQQTLSPFGSSEGIMTLGEQFHKSRLVHPYSSPDENRGQGKRPSHWKPDPNSAKEVSRDSNARSAAQWHNDTETSIVTTKMQQPWEDTKRPSTTALHHSQSFHSLSSFDMPPTNLPYVSSHISAGPDLTPSSVSGPGTPLQHGRAVPSNRQLPRGLPSGDEISHLCQFFMLNFAAHIPIVLETDINDDPDVLNKSKRPLAYAMAYVAARFVPGCRSVRAILMPEILSILKTRFDLTDRTDEESWTLLQAFAVLYNWATPVDVVQNMGGGGVEDVELRQDSLRSSMEMLALRCGLHRSGEQVIGLIKANASNLKEHFAFRKYCYWLWLYNTAHFHSLFSGTPPTIREDASIRWADQNLEKSITSEPVMQLLAEVGLGLIWAQPGQRESSLAEWWCLASRQHDEAATTTIKTNLEGALKLWHRRWHRPQQHPNNGFASDSVRSRSLDFHYRLARFCTSSHVHKLSEASTSSSPHTLSSAHLLAQSVQGAVSICQLFLEMDPVARSSIRFAPETTFTMLASAAEWIIRAKGTSAGMACVKPADIEAVQCVAELMVDLAVDSRHSARFYGEGILSRLQTADHDKMAGPVSMHYQEQKFEVPWQTSITPTSHMPSRNLDLSSASVENPWPLKRPSSLPPDNTEYLLGLDLAPGENGGNFPSNYDARQHFQLGSNWPV